MNTSIEFDAATAQLVATTSHAASCCAARVMDIAENDAANIITGDLSADYFRTVESFVEEAGELLNIICSC